MAVCLAQRLIALACQQCDLLYAGWQRRNCDGARPLAHCCALAPSPSGVAFSLVRRLLWSAVSLAPPRLGKWQRSGSI